MSAVGAPSLRSVPPYVAWSGLPRLARRRPTDHHRGIDPPGALWSKRNLMAAIDWYYAHAGEQFGPYSAADIKRLADSGKLLPEDLVWREGMEEWIAARKVKGLFGEGPAGAKSGAKKGGDFAVAQSPPPPPESDEDTDEDPAIPSPEPDPVDVPRPPRPIVPAEPARPAFHSTPPQPPANGSASHPLSGLLDFVRDQFPAHFVQSTARVFAAMGHWALYAVLVLAMVFALALAARTGRTEAALLGLVAALVIVVLQFSAARFLPAIERVLHRPEAALSSTALPDVAATFGLALGIVLLLGHTAWAIHLQFYWLASGGVVSFIALEYLAFVALSPETVGVRVEPAAAPAEEALGTIVFLGRSLGQLVPVLYGAGVVWCGLRIVYGLIVLLTADPSVACIIAAYEGAWTIAFALLPATGYFGLLGLSLAIDLVRGIANLARRPEQGRGADDSQALL